jgi:sarcosine oxidase subunit gamma
MADALDMQHPAAGIGAGVEEVPDCALVIVRSDSASPAIATALGIAPAERPNKFVEACGRLIAWLGPDEWIVIGARGEEARLCSRLDLALEGTHHAVVDISGSRAVFRLSGTSARALLSAACSLDFHPRLFGVGDCAQTNFARTGALILMRDDRPTFDVVVRRSYASYVLGWLRAAIGVGVGVGGTGPGCSNSYPSH